MVPSVKKLTELNEKAVSYNQNGSGVHSNFETLIRYLEVEKWNFELKLRNSKLKLQKNFKSSLRPIF